MGFEELRHKFLYLHKKRDLSKRRNKFQESDDKENRPVNVSRTSSRLSSSKKSENFSLELRSKKDLGSSYSNDLFEKYEPEKDPKNKARYLPPSRLKKQISNYQGRRTVKFKETNEYSEEQFGSLKREKRPAPRKIMCVTEIMVDISDTDSSGDYEDTTSQEKLSPQTNEGFVSPLNLSNSSNPPSDSKYCLPPDKFNFMTQIRKRSQKRREKEFESKAENQLSAEQVHKVHSGAKFKIPYIQAAMGKQYAKNLEVMIMKKFNDKKSINKIIQKTAKLQKNLQEQEMKPEVEDDTTGQAIRYCMMQRIKSMQLARAKMFSGSKKKRGKIDIKFIKLQFQNIERSKRKTKNFHLYDEAQLDFPDANNLMKKRLHQFEFDNDIDSDEDEITKSAYIRLKDLTVTLKETLNKGMMLENDPDDLAIKKHVGYTEKEEN
jgi:hypothetical protein